jgi:hypothetical protein
VSRELVKISQATPLVACIDRQHCIAVKDGNFLPSCPSRPKHLPINEENSDLLGVDSNTRFYKLLPCPPPKESQAK